MEELSAISGDYLSTTPNVQAAMKDLFGPIAESIASMSTAANAGLVTRTQLMTQIRSAVSMASAYVVGGGSAADVKKLVDAASKS